MVVSCSSLPQRLNQIHVRSRVWSDANTAILWLDSLSRTRCKRKGSLSQLHKIVRLGYSISFLRSFIFYDHSSFIETRTATTACNGPSRQPNYRYHPFCPQSVAFRCILLALESPPWTPDRTFWCRRRGSWQSRLGDVRRLPTFWLSSSTCCSLDFV